MLYRIYEVKSSTLHTQLRGNGNETVCTCMLGRTVAKLYKKVLIARLYCYIDGGNKSSKNTLCGKATFAMDNHYFSAGLRKVSLHNVIRWGCWTTAFIRTD